MPRQAKPDPRTTPSEAAGVADAQLPLGEVKQASLLPDDALLGGSFRSRLALNRQTVDLLTYPPDTASDAKRLDRLQRSASAMAAAAKRYVQSQDPQDLARLDLTSVRKILDGDKPPPLPHSKPLLDLLDVKEDEVRKYIRAKLDLETKQAY